MRTLWFVVFFWGISAQLFGQAPVSNLYMFDFQRMGDTAFKFTKPRYLTYFNANGYNNHPFFASADEIYFASQKPMDEQPDILRMSLRDSSLLKLTDTYEGEYSPRRPFFEYSNYYLIRMEFLRSDTLIRLWQISNSGYGNYGTQPVFQDLTNVGYYEWIQPRLVALHLNGSPNTLALAAPGSNNVTPVAQNVGRCFRLATMSNRLIYLQKNTSGPGMLMSLDVRNFNPSGTFSPTSLIAPIANSEDFALLNDGTLLMASGSRLYKFKPNLDREWILVADFADHNLSKITRLEINRENNKIILVN